MVKLAYLALSGKIFNRSSALVVLECRGWLKSDNLISEANNASKFFRAIEAKK